MLTQKLVELGLSLPELNPPLASYVPAKLDGNQVWVSGQLPMQAGALMLNGPLQKGSDLDRAQEAMRICFLNGLAAAAQIIELDQLAGVLQLGAYVAASADFDQHHLVANGASNLAQELFGESGRHSRFAVGVSSLPLGATVELSIVFQVKSNG